VALPDGSLELFWGAGVLYEMRYPSETVQKLPGVGPLGSAPTAVLDANHQVHVFWQGTNRWLWEFSLPEPSAGADQLSSGSLGSASSAGPVELSSGPLGSAPSAVIYPGNGQDVFWRDPHGELRRMRWYSKKWHPSAAVPYARRLGSAPTAVMFQ
jgi:hypothetical protein